MQHVVRPLALLVILAFAVPITAAAHEDSSSWAPLSALHQWVDAINSRDYAVAENGIAGDFHASHWPETKAEFLDYMKRRTFSNLSLRYMRFEKNGSTTTFRRIAALDGRPGFVAEFVISFEQLGGEQKIVQAEILGPARSELAAILRQPDLPEQHPTVPVSFSLVDAETGKPSGARISVLDARGEYWPPRGHQKYISVGWREDVGGDVIVAHRTFAYVDPDVMLDLSPGEYDVQIAKGMEFNPVSRHVTVLEDGINRFEFRIGRWINMQAAGWFAGDTHTHFLEDHNAILEAKGESLNILNVLATKWGQLITNVANIRGAPSPVSDADHIVYYNEEARHNFLGHTILHPLKSPVFPLSWGGPSEGVVGGSDFPPMARLADEAHGQGAAVTWAHFPYPGGEVAVDVGLHKVDSVDLLTWEDPFFLPTSKDGSDPPPSVVAWWYKFLNTGARLPASAGTDKMFNTQIVGAVRTYAYIGKGPLTYDAWVEAIRKGRTFITSGPMLTLTADSRGIGSVLTRKPGDKVRVEASVKAPAARFPWKRFEILQNGRVVAAVDNSSGQGDYKLSATVEVRGSAWIASRVYVSTDGSGQALDDTGLNQLPPAAHTSPIYIDVKGDTLWNEDDADYLAKQCEAAIRWAREVATYQTPDERRSVIELYERARDYYRRSRRN